MVRPFPTLPQPGTGQVNTCLEMCFGLATEALFPPFCQALVLLEWLELAAEALCKIPVLLL